MDLTKFLAVYAAFLSTAVFLWNVFKSQSKIRVKLILALEKREGEFVHGVQIAVQNPSNHTVHLTGISVLNPWRKTSLKDAVAHVIRFRRWPIRLGWMHSDLSLYGIDDGCPMILEPRASHTILIPDDVLELILEEATHRKLKAVVQDALWRRKFSVAFDYPELQIED